MKKLIAVLILATLAGCAGTEGFINIDRGKHNHETATKSDPADSEPARDCAGCDRGR